MIVNHLHNDYCQALIFMFENIGKLTLQSGSFVGYMILCFPPSCFERTWRQTLKTKMFKSWVRTEYFFLLCGLALNLVLSWRLEADFLPSQFINIHEFFAGSSCDGNDVRNACAACLFYPRNDEGVHHGMEWYCWCQCSAVWILLLWLFLALLWGWVVPLNTVLCIMGHDWKCFVVRVHFTINEWM